MLKPILSKTALSSILRRSATGLNLPVQLTAFGLLILLTTGGVQAAPGTPVTGEASETATEPSAAIARLLPNQLLLSVQGMVCGMCVQGITKQIQELNGVTEVEIDLEAGSVLVTASSRQGLPSAAQLRAAVTRAGYEVQEVHGASTGEGE